MRTVVAFIAGATIGGFLGWMFAVLDAGVWEIDETDEAAA